MRRDNPPTAEKNVEQNADTPSSKTVETKTTYKNNWRAKIGTYRFVSCLLVYMSGHLFADASSVLLRVDLSHVTANCPKSVPQIVSCFAPIKSRMQASFDFFSGSV